MDIWTFNKCYGRKCNQFLLATEMQQKGRLPGDTPAFTSSPTYLKQAIIWNSFLMFSPKSGLSLMTFLNVCQQ